MSLNSWKRYGKMSPKQNRIVPQLVEKYRREFPELEKRFIRKLILAEHKELFQNDSEVRKLTRYLEQAFRDNIKTKETNLVPKSSKGQTERERLVDALIGYHEPTYFKKLP